MKFKQEYQNIKPLRRLFGGRRTATQEELDVHDTSLKPM